MAKKKNVIAEQLVAEAEGLGAKELVEGRLYFPSEKKKVVPKTMEKTIPKAGKKPAPTIRKTQRKLRKIPILSQKTRYKDMKSSVKASQKQFSQYQGILRGLFGGGVGRRVLGDTRPKINKTLQGADSPFGLIKNGDNGATASLFLPTKSRRRTL